MSCVYVLFDCCWLSSRHSRIYLYVCVQNGHIVSRERSLLSWHNKYKTFIPDAKWQITNCGFLEKTWTIHTICSTCDAHSAPYPIPSNPQLPSNTLLCTNGENKRSGWEEGWGGGVSTTFETNHCSTVCLTPAQIPHNSIKENYGYTDIWSPISFGCLCCLCALAKSDRQLLEHTHTHTHIQFWTNSQKKASNNEKINKQKNGIIYGGRHHIARIAIVHYVSMRILALALHTQYTQTHTSILNK